jgi:ATP-binding cassette, subfamily B, multidrug efflux pump
MMSPKGGSLIDGVDVRDIPQKQLHKMVAVALQEAVLFTGTVRGNILMGKRGGDDDEMLAAAEAADADSFVRNIPEAVRCAGGPARGQLLRRPAPAPVYCPRSGRRAEGPDPGRQHQRAGPGDRSLCAGGGAGDDRQRPSLYVAQRISTVLTADKIVLLDGGRQVALGKHNDLVKSSPLYRDICLSQLGMVPELHEAEATAKNGRLRCSP